MDPTKLEQTVIADGVMQTSLGEHFPLMENVIIDWIHATAEIAAQNQEHGYSFNPLTQIKMEETTHSRILGNLLSPQGSHGQGALFLKVFLENLGYPDPDSDDWQVTIETGRVDILIWRNHPEKSAIIIENKSNNAGDQLNQIYRYWHQEMYLWDRHLWDTRNEAAILQRSLRFHIVYLPTNSEKSPADHSLKRPNDWTAADNPHSQVPLKSKTLSVPELTELWIERAWSTIPLTNTRLRDFLIQYHELWQS
ncbi:hypothetical protein BH11VER1_BH11VER1_09040 [soil metagenome]